MSAHHSHPGLYLTVVLGVHDQHAGLPLVHLGLQLLHPLLVESPGNGSTDRVTREKGHRATDRHPGSAGLLPEARAHAAGYRGAGWPQPGASASGEGKGSSRREISPYGQVWLDSLKQQFSTDVTQDFFF